MPREQITECAKREMVNAYLRGDNPFTQKNLSSYGEIGEAIEKGRNEKGDTIFVITNDFMMELIWEIRIQRRRRQYILDRSVALSNGGKVPNYPND
jgi:wobble nucleotide-excising tRNase